jgi:hypothetical protein
MKVCFHVCQETTVSDLIGDLQEKEKGAEAPL